MSVGFGETSGERLTSVAGQIFTFDESRDDQSVREQIAEFLFASSRIVFLDFAFYPQNMRLLFDQPGIDFREAFATCYGFSHPRQVALE